MQETKRPPKGAKTIQAHKDRVFDAEIQPVPCIGCLRWHYCGAFNWTSCKKMGRYLRIRKEAYCNED